MSNRNYGLVKSEADLTRFVDKLVTEGLPFAFDIETGYLEPMRAKGSLQHYAPDYVVAGISFTNNPDWARYAPLNHKMGGSTVDLDNGYAARELWRLLRTGLGIAHNALMELSGMSRFFRDNLSDDHEIIPGTQDTFHKGHTFADEVNADGGLYPILSDTMLESMLTGEHKLKGLKPLSHDILHVDQVELMVLFKERGLKGLNAKGKYAVYNTTNLRFNALPLDADVVNYACEDSALTLEHHERTYPQVKDLLIFKTELRLTPILVRMEREGMYLDWAEYERRSRDVEVFKDLYAEYVMDTFSEITGELININLNSPKQVSEVLFNKMGIKPTTYTDTGAASTGEKAMRMLLGKHPEIKSLLQYREVAKLLGTYINKYLNEFRYDPTGRAHPSHKQEGAGTGRFSVDGVSYQQWPKPYHFELPSGQSLDLNYRNFLISPENSRIIGFDYANVELRIIAGLANERAMLEAFANGVDIHKATASLMLKVALEDVTDKQRSVGKTLNFAIVYGSGADNIATLITAATGELCTVEQAEAYLANYFKAFPDLKQWMDDRVLEGHEVHAKTVPTQAAHWVTTAFGRRIPIFEYESDFRGVRAKGDRNAVNGPVQGAAADYMKIGMVRVDKAIRVAEEEGRIPRGSVRLIMTIHDALEFYVDKAVDTQTVIDIVEPAVSYVVTKDWTGAPMSLPVIRADWHEGYRWGSVAEIEHDADDKIIYKRKLELPDKTKQSFIADSLDELVADIEKFWTERNTAELDARVIEELEFEYDEDEDEIIVPDHTNYVTDEQIETRAERARQSFLAPKEEPVAEVPDDEDEPPWLHSKEEPVVHLQLKLAAMPNSKNWPEFKEFVKAHPGTGILDVSMPQGEVSFKDVGITPSHTAELQLMFGEATLTMVEPAQVNEKVLEGLSL